MEIDLVELFHALLNRIYIIILAGILAAFAAFAWTQLFVTPKYTSTTSMYMMAKSSSDAAITSTDLQMATQLTPDYMEIAKSRTVLEKVIATLNLDMTAGELSSCITTSNTSNTRIMTITVEHEDPELAQDIANTLREAAGDEIVDIMGIEAVNTIEEADLPTGPSSPSVMKNTVFGGALGILLSAGVLILIYLLDDTIKTPDDVERYLGLSLLTSIPLQAGEEKAKMISHKFVRTIKAQLEKTGCPILGVVLNKVDMKRDKYYRRYYGKYYGNYESES